jgi:hypothetical protein
VTNSTFYSNSSPFGSAIDMTFDTLTVTNSTFVGNLSTASPGGTIYIESLPNTGVRLNGTIFADSTGSNCNIPTSSFLSPGDAGYNLSDDDSRRFTQSTSANDVTDAELKQV